MEQNKYPLTFTAIEEARFDDEIGSKVIRWFDLYCMEVMGDLTNEEFDELRSLKFQLQAIKAENDPEAYENF